MPGEIEVILRHHIFLNGGKDYRAKYVAYSMKCRDDAVLTICTDHISGIFRAIFFGI